VPGTIETPADSIENWLAEDKSIENEDIVGLSSIYTSLDEVALPLPFYK
jgi:hypothetical protein